MTFGSFSTTNANSTIASLGSHALGLGHGVQSADGYLLVRADADADSGRAHRSRGLRLPLAELVDHQPGFPGGRFQFNGAYTRANNSAALNDRAQSWAQFLLGLPTAATGERRHAGYRSRASSKSRSPGEFTQMYHGLFVQDDWRVNPKLTRQSGVRLEINSGMTEARIAISPGSTRPRRIRSRRRRRPRTRAAPIPEIPVSSFRVPGGLQFADGPVNETRPSSCRARRSPISSISAPSSAPASGCSRTTTSSRTSTRSGFSQARRSSTPTTTASRSRART